jgi:succinoglycan biosynthesis transport protein ExoP
MPELTLREVGTMLTRRRGIIYVTVLVFLMLGILALTFSTRRYRSIGEIELQKDSPSSLGLQTDSADTSSDALEVNMLIQTQAKILARNRRPSPGANVGLPGEVEPAR